MFRLATAIALTVLGAHYAVAVSSAYSANLNDPTRPARSSVVTTTSAKKVKLNLNSTLISPQRTLAVINGKTVLQGEKIGGYQLVDIKPGRVWLKRGKRTLVLKLLPRSVKRRAETILKRNK